LKIDVARDATASSTAKAAWPAGTGSAIAVTPRRRDASGARSGMNGRTDRAIITRNVALAVAIRNATAVFTSPRLNGLPNATVTPS